MKILEIVLAGLQFPVGIMNIGNAFVGAHTSGFISFLIGVGLLYFGKQNFEEVMAD